jgi:hypothetical protein
MEYPGVRLGQRGGLFDLYQYYLGGGDDSQDTTDPGTQESNTTGGNQDGFSVYNPDPNRVRQPIGSPYPDINFDGPLTQEQLADYRFQQNRANAGAGYYGDPNYIGGFSGNITQTGPGRQFTGDEAMIVGDPRDLIKKDEEDIGFLASVRQNVLKNPLFKVAAAIYNPASALVQGGIQFLQENLPVNARAIQETQLSQQGIAIDDIGRVAFQNFGIKEDGTFGALGAYDPSGVNIMAGYNANMITQDTFDKRRKKAKEKMSPKGFEEFNIALTAAEDLWKKTQEVSEKIVDKREFDRRKEKREKIQEDLAAAGFGESGAVGLDPDMDKQIIDDYTYTPPSRDDTSKAPPSKPKQSTFQESYEREDRDTGSSGGGASYDSGSAGTSAGKSSSRGRTDGGWGWKDGGLVQRKPYGNGGIVDLL